MASIDSDTAQVREAPWKKDSHYLGSIWDSGSTRAVGGAQGTVQSGLCALRVNFVDIKSVEFVKKEPQQDLSRGGKYVSAVADVGKGKVNRTFEGSQNWGKGSKRHAFALGGAPLKGKG
ncbi:hypothetical protein K438DRAFT_1771066 [Mycena galopus ATCC 62051]|nr:hypothetical protein K438DRAFT_1771066 [Mycena galopus ATCC 62051]